MAPHVRTTIRYDGPILADHEMDVQDLAPALLALSEIVQIANRKFNGEAASIRVLVNADVEQKCFQIDLALVQSVVEQAKGLFSDDGLKTALDIAKSVGIVAGSAVSLFKLAAILARRPAAGTKLEVKKSGDVTVIVTGDGNNVRVSNDVYALASDPAVIEKVKKVVQPLKLPGYETLSFVADEKVVETITREDAREITEAPNALVPASREDVQQIKGPIRIKSPQYVGVAKWTVYWGGRPIDVTMPPDWVEQFQSNDVFAPPHTILDVEMEQRVPLDEKGAAIGSPAFTVLKIFKVKLPEKALKQGDLLTDRETD
jgi:hypothetical protein